MIFRKRHQREAPSAAETDSAPQQERLAHPIGATILPSELVKEKETPTVEVLNQKRVHAVLEQVNAAQQNFLEDALTRGLSEKEISDAAKSAVSTGDLPRIVKALSFRGSGSSFAILHGPEIPSEVLNVNFVKTHEGAIQSMYIERPLGAKIPYGQMEEVDRNGLYQDIVGWHPNSTPEDWAGAADLLEAAIVQYVPPLDKPHNS